MQGGENLVEIMHGQHFANSGVVVEYQITRVRGRVVVTQTGFGPAHESCVALR